MNVPIHEGGRPRAYSLSRKTKETDITLSLNLDGERLT